MPSYILWYSLEETQDVFTRLSKQYHNQAARRVAWLADQAIIAEAYANPLDYVQRMKTIAELELEVENEFPEQINPILPDEYQDMVMKLIVLIDELLGDYSPNGIIWKDAARVAKMQLEICDIVEQILK